MAFLEFRFVVTLGRNAVDRWASRGTSGGVEVIHLMLRQAA